MFCYFFQEIGFDISCESPLRRRFAWNVESFFLGKIRKNISPVCRLLIIPRECWRLKSHKWEKLIRLRQASWKLIAYMNDGNSGQHAHALCLIRAFYVRLEICAIEGCFVGSKCPEHSEDAPVIALYRLNVPLTVYKHVGTLLMWWSRFSAMEHLTFRPE